MQISELKPGHHIHLIGICGTAMASLAGLLQDRGFKVTGSDSAPYPPMSTQLESLGIPVVKGYSARNLDPVPDFVIVGNVISANNEEAQELVRLQVPYTSLPKAMGEFIIAGREAIVVAGTHGKTTTTSMMSWICEVQGLKPGFLIGGIPKNFSKSFQNPNGQYFVIEGDEYDTAYFDKVPKFIHYRPRHVILTSIEFDHADIYLDLNAVKAAFTQLLKLIPTDGTLIYCAEEKNIQDILPACLCKRQVSYGIEKGDYQARVIQMNDAGTEFELIKKSQPTGEIFKTKMGGRYNVLNALACLALADSLELAKDKVKEGLLTFAGVKRRQEVLGEPGGVLVIEDFAHHPTAVRETILGIQAKYPKKKFFSVFEPRSATSRRKVFQQDYLTAFSGAHETLIAQAFDQSKIDAGDRFSSDELVAELKARGGKAGVFTSADEIVGYLLQQSKPGDGILIMSNGGFDGIYQKLLSGLARR
ncbi:MAG: UDP-N-acetylmuramate:L-alanyl-gamma-D-glutamyl-meso-diaminopimelate ligase [Bdellovibrio sp.]|jgi:UDP-N-acetylmuramate: L-alanyl-gamma-D-glutamyl-meso-diaminopimelate ligase